MLNLRPTRIVPIFPVFRPPSILSFCRAIRPFSKSATDSAYNELTPGITKLEYEQRRSRLMKSLPERSVVLVKSADIKFMSANIFYSYRPSSALSYLSGLHEPHTALMLISDPSSSRGYKFSIFSRGASSPHDALWDGVRITHDQIRTFGSDVDDVQHIDRLHESWSLFAAKASNVFVDGPGLEPSAHKGVKRMLQLPFKKAPFPLSPYLATLRLIKSPAEQALMKKAADISGRAHAKTMRFTNLRSSGASQQRQPYGSATASVGEGEPLREAQIEAHFEYLCRLAGAQRLAYVPVVASGANGRVIHYTRNDDVVEDGETILLDAGCEFNGYASDITRTFPSSPSGTFSQPQRDLYAAVLSAQKQTIALCTVENAISQHDLHKQSADFLKQELKQIGFNFGGFSGRGAMSRLYPHFVSHPIGMDLHESTGNSRDGPLQEGMVITVEPGVYVPPNVEFPKAFWDLAVRIEDEVLISSTGPVVLSSSAPKEIADVEAACQGSLGLSPF